MHHVFWVLFLLMLVYAVFARPGPVRVEEGSEYNPGPRYLWAAWMAGRSPFRAA